MSSVEFIIHIFSFFNLVQFLLKTFLELFFFIKILQCFLPYFLEFSDFLLVLFSNFIIQ